MLERPVLPFDAAFPTLQALLAHGPPRVGEEISERDGMFAGNREHYFGVGASGQTGYGISLSSLGWVLAQVQRQPGLRVGSCIEHGWDGHQDVVACVRERS